MKHIDLSTSTYKGVAFATIDGDICDTLEEAAPFGVAAILTVNALYVGSLEEMRHHIGKLYRDHVGIKEDW